MIRMNAISSAVRLLPVVALTALLAGCTLENPDGNPPLVGPSEFGLSVTMSARPDQLPRDGSSQSEVTLTVRNADGSPDVGRRVTLAVSGPQGASLSQTEVTTDGSGNATFAVIAPPQSAVGPSALIVAATPIGTNAAGAFPRLLTIALLGTPNTTAPAPDFTISPEAPEVNQLVTFDASPTMDEGAPCLDNCTYGWNFDDGTFTFGRVVTHRFGVGRDHTVTLTVVDSAGVIAEARKIVRVNTAAPPALTITVTPDPPFVGMPAVFAVAGAAAPGHSIQRYEWNFGDGTTTTTTVPTVVKIYANIGTYVVTVTAVDDLGQTGTAALPVTVAHVQGAPVARFTISPQSPSAGQQVTFNATGSTVGQGLTITNYVWNFGDGSPDVDTGTTPSTTHTYAAAGTYVVTLRITDSLGQEAITTATVTVQ